MPRLRVKWPESGVLSVVIVNWNADRALDACLEALFSATSTRRMEILLVDNASTDGSQARAVETYSGIKLLQNTENLGFACAANQALERAVGEQIMLLNPDVVLRPDSIGLLADFMDKHPDAAVVAPKLLNPDGTVQGSGRRDPSFWTGLFGRDAPLTRLFPNNPLTHREVPSLRHVGDGPLEVDWVSGACFLMRRVAYERVGGLDERFFLFWEDADWCRRCRGSGWKVYYLPTAVGAHDVGVSRAKRPLRSTLDFHRSAYRFYRKHHLASPLHPMILPLMGGLLLSLGVRVLQGTLLRR